MELSLRLECFFEDTAPVAAFADLLENRPEELLAQLHRHCLEAEGQAWTYRESGSALTEGLQVTGGLVFGTPDRSVWKSLGPGLAALGVRRARVSRLSQDLMHPTGIIHVADGAVVTPDRWALDARRDEPLVAALLDDDAAQVPSLLATTPPADAAGMAALLGAERSLAALLAQAPALLDQPDAHGNTPLANALIGRQMGTLRQLLAAGANVNATVRLTPALLELEALERFMVDASDLWSHRATYRYCLDSVPVADGNSAVEWALVQGPYEAAHLLLDHHAELCWPENDEALSTVDACIDGNSPELLQRLLARAVAEGRSEPANEHWLDHAIYLQRYEMAGLLLAHGCDINRPNENGEPPLHRATLTHFGLQPNQSMEFLLARGAQVDGVDSQGRTALMCAFSWMDQMTHPRMQGFHWLLSAGASTKAKDHEGHTVAWHAKQGGVSLKEVQAASKQMSQEAAAAKAA